jgi:hypothetical protein
MKSSLLHQMNDSGISVFLVVLDKQIRRLRFSLPGVDALRP